MPDFHPLILQLQTAPLAELIEAFADRSAALRQFLPQERPWGQEQWMPLHIAAAARPRVGREAAGEAKQETEVAGDGGDGGEGGEGGDGGRVEVVDWLLSQGVRPDCRTRFITPLHARQTPLHLAAQAGHVAVVQRLFEASAEVEVHDAQRRSPLWLAARHRRARVVELLCRRGADLESRDAQGRTPLHAALLPLDEAAAGSIHWISPPPHLKEGGIRDAGEGEVSDGGGGDGGGNDGGGDEQEGGAALMLLEAGADPNATCPKDPEGFTPLHRCVMRGRVASPVAHRLLALGANTDLADPRHGRTVRDLAEHLKVLSTLPWLA